MGITWPAVSSAQKKIQAKCAAKYQAAPGSPRVGSGE
jgi:hypothetical protein